MNPTWPYSSNPFDSDPIHRPGEPSPVSDHDIEELVDGYFAEIDEDFWYDEEERHELF